MSREKFATQVDSDILLAVRALPRIEERQLQALVEETLSDLIEKRRKGRPQLPRAQATTAAAVTRQAVAAIDQLCQGIEGLEACADADLGRLTGNDAAALQSLVKRLQGLADRLAPSAPQNRPAPAGEDGLREKPETGTAPYPARSLSVVGS